MQNTARNKNNVSVWARENKALFQTKVNCYKRNKMFKWAYWSSTAQTLEKYFIMIFWWGKSSSKGKYFK